MINSYLIMVTVSFASFYLTTDTFKLSQDGLLNMSWSLAFGSFVGFVYTFFLVFKNKLNNV